MLFEARCFPLLLFSALIEPSHLTAITVILPRHFPFYLLFTPSPAIRFLVCSYIACIGISKSPG